MTESTDLSALTVDVQNTLSEADDLEGEEPPSLPSIVGWARKAYAAVDNGQTEVTIRIADEDEVRQLNCDYRHQDKPTNVLSFPVELPPSLAGEMELALLGDIVICHPVIVKEAQQQQKTVNDHYAHMVTHGLLHLCGYDHQDDVSAAVMESLEVEILAQSDVSNPYE